MFIFSSFTGVCISDYMLYFYVQRNYSLLRVDLSWNGLGYDGALSLSQALKVNKYIKELDVSSNRLTWNCAAVIASGLRDNYTLEVLKVGQPFVRDRSRVEVPSTVAVVKTCVESSIKSLVSIVQLVFFGYATIVYMYLCTGTMQVKKCFSSTL